MDVEVDEEYGDWRDDLSKDEEAKYLASVLEHLPDRRRISIVVTVMDATGQTRTVTVKRFARATNKRFSTILAQLADGARIVALRRVETCEWIVKDVPLEILKTRLITNSQRARRRWGKKD